MGSRPFQRLSTCTHRPSHVCTPGGLQAARRSLLSGRGRLYKSHSPRTSCCPDPAAVRGPFVPKPHSQLDSPPSNHGNSSPALPDSQAPSLPAWKRRGAVTTCPGSAVPSAALGHTCTASPEQGQAGLLLGTRPWTPHRGTPARPPRTGTRRPPLGQLLQRLPSSCPMSTGHGGHGGCQPRGPRAPCKVVRALAARARWPGAGRGARLTCRHRSCRRSPPCSAGRASCRGPHACLHGEEKHRLATSQAPDAGTTPGGPGLASV